MARYVAGAEVFAQRLLHDIHPGERRVSKKGLHNPVEYPKDSSRLERLQ
jgi:hypothetical protein